MDTSDSKSFQGECHHIIIKTESPEPETANGSIPDAIAGVAIKQEWSNSSNQLLTSMFNDELVQQEDVKQNQVKCPIPGLLLGGKFYPAYCDVRVKDEVVDIKQEPESEPQAQAQAQAGPRVEKARADESHASCSRQDFNNQQLNGKQKQPTCERRRFKRESNDTTEPDVLQLILTIQNHTCLYNPGHYNYNNAEVTEQIWDLIARQCHFSNGDAARSEWTKLKEIYRRHALNRNSSKQTWKYKEAMQFMMPFIKTEGAIPSHVTPNGSTENSIGVNTDVVEEFPETHNSHSEPSCSKRPRISNEAARNPTESLVQNKAPKTPQTRERSMDLFFMSMCESTKNLPSPLQLRIKRKVFEIVCEAEEFANNTDEPYNIPTNLY